MQAIDEQDAPVLQVPQKLAPIWQPKRYKVMHGGRGGGKSWSVAGVLLAMAIPLSIAGWGVREGAAALVWQAAGLDPAQGVAISISYGVVILLSSLPGALMLLRRGPEDGAPVR